MAFDLYRPVTQEAFADLVGVSQQAISELVLRETLPRGGNLKQWLHAYCGNLREQAAGRAARGELELAGERARLAREQADRIAMQNAVSRRELAPVAVLEDVLARLAAQVVSILEAIPIHVKRRVPALTVEDLALITEECNKARNLAATVAVEIPDLDEEDDAGTVSPGSATSRV
ncbi:MAG: terminase small subunit [Burkholderiales bacterium]|nr:terminase small subunit [Burkholderiales bacterium]